MVYTRKQIQWSGNKRLGRAAGLENLDVNIPKLLLPTRHLIDHHLYLEIYSHKHGTVSRLGKYPLMDEATNI